MNRKKIVVIISTLVIVFSVICSVLPLITKNELADKTVISTFGETVTLYGKGLYARNSVSSAVQAIAQDMVTLTLIVPTIGKDTAPAGLDNCNSLLHIFSFL